MANSPEGSNEGRGGELDDTSWMYDNPSDDLFDEDGNLKFPPYGHEDLYINLATGKPYTDGELAHEDRIPLAVESPEVKKRPDVSPVDDGAEGHLHDLAPDDGSPQA